MNKLYFVVALCCLMSPLLLSAQCPTSLTITSQVELNEFPANYPNCTEIEGSVELEGNIISFTPLFQLERIGGSLILNDIRAGQINDFANLKYIGGDLRITNCENLTFLNGFNALDTINGALKINSDSLLQNIQGFNNLQYVNGKMSFSSNQALNSINAFSGLTAVKGDIDLNDVPIDTIAGFGAFSNFGGTFSIRSTQLRSLDFLGNLLNIDGGFRIIANPKIPHLKGLKRLKHAGRSIVIYNNDLLGDLSGLDSLQWIGGTLDVAGNKNMLSLNGIGQLDSIGDDLVLWFNNLLQDFSGLNQLKSINNLLVFDNLQITSFKGLDSLLIIKGQADIYQNPNLENLKGLDNLEEISVYLTIFQNLSLASLDGLNGLQRTPRLEIMNNAKLENLSALNNMDNVVQFLRIANNPLLSYCAVEPICTYLTNGGNGAFILDNAFGCSSKIEILNACTSGSTEQWANTLECFPNPVLNTLRISAPAEGAFYRYELFSMTGTLVASTDAQAVTEIDMRHLPEGVYQLRGLSQRGMVQRLIVKTR